MEAAFLSKHSFMILNRSHIGTSFTTFVIGVWKKLITLKMGNILDYNVLLVLGTDIHGVFIRVFSIQLKEKKLIYYDRSLQEMVIMV